MSHALASALTRSINNVAVLVTATYSNQGMAQVFRASDEMPIATVVELEGHYEVFLPGGSQHYCSTIGSVHSVIKACTRFPANVNQCRSWSKIVHVEETF